jgi:hypothetical protein
MHFDGGHTLGAVRSEFHTHLAIAVTGIFPSRD